MGSWLAELALILLAGGVFAAAVSTALSLAWPALASWLRRVDPATRARAAIAIALAPVLVSTALVALCLVPGVLAWFGWRGDHCLAHTDHPHLCLAHHPGALTAPLVALLVLAGAGAAIGLVRVAAQLARARRRSAALARNARGSLAPGVTLVHGARPFSLAAGLIRPRIWISTALADALSREQLEVVIAHERGHVRGRDALWRWIAAAGSLPLLPAVRRALLAELALAGEQACDEAAGVRVGDRLLVAETIVAVERMLGAARPPEPLGTLAFGGSTVPDRVRSLVAEPCAALPTRYAIAVAAALALVAPLAVGRVHHLTEHLLGALLRAL